MKSFLERIAPIWKPHPGQESFLLCESKRKVLACGRRWGKTDACAALVLKSLLAGGKRERIIVVGPTLDQARLLFDRVEFLLYQFLELTQVAERPKIKRSPYPMMEFEDHVLMARSGDNPDSLRGNDATQIIIDEAAFVPERLITEVAMPMLATNDGTLTLISTPNGQNHFWRFFRMGERGQHGMWAMQAPTSQNPMVSAEFLQIQRELISDRAFRTEYESEFIDSAGRVFSADVLDGALVPMNSLQAEPPFYIGVDWARYHDYTAVVVLCGSIAEAKVIHVSRFNGLTWAAQIDRVSQIVNQYHGASVLCDKTGMGDPLLEQLQRVMPNHSIMGLGFDVRSKTDLIDRLRLSFERQAIRMAPDPQLLRELEHFESRNGKLEAVGGYHDDLVIALALAHKQLPMSYSLGVLMGEARRFARRALPKTWLRKFSGG